MELNKSDETVDYARNLSALVLVVLQFVVNGLMIELLLFIMLIIVIRIPVFKAN